MRELFDLTGYDMNLLVTGGGGYIGRNFLRRVSAGSLDSKLFAICRNIPADVLPNVEYIECDMAEKGWSKKLPSGIDVVVHLAQSKMYRQFPDGNADMLAVNVMATAELLEWGRKTGIKKFIFASTGNVYKPSAVLHKESDICEPGTMYGVSKLAAENIVKLYKEYFNVVVMRIFGVYGGGQHGMVIADVAQKVISGEEIALPGGSGLSLTPLYIDDMTEILSCLISYDQGESYICCNVAGSRVVTLKEIAEVICELTGLSMRSRSTNEDPIRILGDAAFLARIIGHPARTDFKDGLSEMLRLMQAGDL